MIAEELNEDSQTHDPAVTSKPQKQTLENSATAGNNSKKNAESPKRTGSAINSKPPT
jgi:hypothetical protein